MKAHRRPVSAAGGGQLSCNSRAGQIKNALAQCSGSNHIRHSYRMGLATTTTAASDRCREELLGQRPARRTCRPRHTRMLGAATRGTKKEPTGLIAYPAAQGRAVRFPYGLHETATTLDIPTGWDLQQRRPRPVTDAGRSCWGSGQQDARAAQGTRGCWEPQPGALKKSPLGSFLPPAGGRVPSIPRTGCMKKSLILRSGILFMTRTGIEPMLQP